MSIQPAAAKKPGLLRRMRHYRNIYLMAIDAVSSGKIHIKDIVSHYFELDEIQDALDQCLEDKANVVKGVIRISD